MPEFKENMLTRSVLCKLFRKGGDIIGSQMKAFISRETQRNILMVMIITEVQKFELSRMQALPPKSLLQEADLNCFSRCPCLLFPVHTYSALCFCVHYCNSFLLFQKISKFFLLNYSQRLKIVNSFKQILFARNSKNLETIPKLSIWVHF